jgi:hypothetical protein
MTLAGDAVLVTHTVLGVACTAGAAYAHPAPWLACTGGLLLVTLAAVAAGRQLSHTFTCGAAALAWVWAGLGATVYWLDAVEPAGSVPGFTAGVASVAVVYVGAWAGLWTRACCLTAPSAARPFTSH